MSEVLLPWINFERGLADEGREWWLFEPWFERMDRVLDILLLRLCDEPEDQIFDD